MQGELTLDCACFSAPNWIRLERMNTDASLWLSMAGFAVATSITPGPNNTMLLASGVNFGFRATLPHALGISVGGLILWMAVGFGLGRGFIHWPWLQDGMRWLGLLYVLYLAYRTASSANPVQASTHQARPISPWTAAAFQWVNPKVWFMVMGYFGSFMPDNPSAVDVVAASAWFSLLNFPCIALWAYAGDRLQHVLNEPRRRRVFNIAMALLLLASMLPMVLSGG